MEYFRYRMLITSKGIEASCVIMTTGRPRGHHLKSADYGFRLTHPQNSVTLW
jgi:hypothetical protein